jgi:Na+/H+ antiporter NhaD/arsenite permease-like protein
VIQFTEFFDLFLPAVVNFVIPAAIMHFVIPRGKPSSVKSSGERMKFGGIAIVLLFLMTIATAVSFYNFLHIPPIFGMMTGLVYLKLYGYYLRRQSMSWSQSTTNPLGSVDDRYSFDVFAKIAKAEWYILFFFYGVILAVGGLGFIGYLSIASEFIYGGLGAINANILIGVMSAVVDNIPVMFAVLPMNPAMSHVQWLLVTLTAGVGGSPLSIGSAAGVALMGQAKGQYTFFSIP